MSDLLSDSRIFHLNEDRNAIVEDVVAREMAEKARTSASMELAINDTAFHEIARLEGGRGDKARLEEWVDLYRTLGRRSAEDKERVLRKLVTANARDIVGNFDPRVYRFATGVVPKGLALLFKNQLKGHSAGLPERIVIEGYTDHLQSLVARGTVILVPTHSSNLDSIVLGFALHQLGLPPFTYGAGKNLFSNFLFSFFMNNLGAYKVDRRLRYKLYKDALKTYSTVILERGFHSLFFPAGGRVRSGAIEQKLKLGLLGTGLAAYINNVIRGKANPEIYIVPCTINYPLVLEARTLMDDHLKELGKSRYIIEDDESSKLRPILAYTKAVLQFEGRMIIRFGEPLDPFGNRVDKEGRSHDARGRAIDLRKYVEVGGVPKHDGARDAEYTRELGAAIADAFKRNNVILTTHMVAFTLMRLLTHDHPDLDVYRLIRLPADQTTLSLPRVLEALSRLRDRLVVEVAAGRLHHSATVADESAERILEVALGYFRMYHRKPLAVRSGDTLALEDLKLLMFYGNRLSGYGLEKAFETAPEAHMVTS
jgi:glycerol-3-phosphate O-acyltransferase